VIDRATIRVVAYGLLTGTLNQKLGPMAQVLVAPDNVPPHVAVLDGRDRAVCGECIHRPANAGTCYVVPQLYIPEVWKQTCHLDADLETACAAIMRSGLPLRMTAWGDIAAVPFEIIQALARAAVSHTAYTSQWRTCDPRLASIAMASVNSVVERHEATARGFRTYRIRTDRMPVLPGEMVCPGSAEAAKKTTCADCLLCDGTGGPSHRDVVVVGHGSVGKIRRLNPLLEEHVRLSVGLGSP
jgi:hypothetical protein